MLQIDILTVFPEMFESPLNASILKRAQEKGLLKAAAHNIREFTFDKRHTTDDTPAGGGAGMVMTPDPVFRAVESLFGLPEGTLRDGDNLDGWQDAKERRKRLGARIIMMSPQGEPFSQKKAWELSREKHLVLICGHYEGLDERIRNFLATDELSIGDYVLTGGELPAMVVMDSVTRLIPGVLGAEESPQEESFSDGLLEYPQYTHPADFRGWKIPEILLQGNHQAIQRWRREQAIRRTLQRRPELFKTIRLTPEDKKLLARILSEEAGL